MAMFNSYVTNYQRVIRFLSLSMYSIIYSTSLKILRCFQYTFSCRSFMGRPPYVWIQLGKKLSGPAASETWWIRNPQPARWDWHLLAWSHQPPPGPTWWRACLISSYPLWTVAVIPAVSVFKALWTENGTRSMTPPSTGLKVGFLLHVRMIGTIDLDLDNTWQYHPG